MRSELVAIIGNRPFLVTRLGRSQFQERISRTKQRRSRARTPANTLAAAPPSHALPPNSRQRRGSAYCIYDGWSGIQVVRTARRTECDSAEPDPATEGLLMTTRSATLVLMLLPFAVLTAATRNEWASSSRIARRIPQRGVWR